MLFSFLHLGVVSARWVRLARPSWGRPFCCGLSVGDDRREMIAPVTIDERQYLPTRGPRRQDGPRGCRTAPTDSGLQWTCYDTVDEASEVHLCGGGLGKFAGTRQAEGTRCSLPSWARRCFLSASEA